MGIKLLVWVPGIRKAFKRKGYTPIIKEKGQTDQGRIVLRMDLTGLNKRCNKFYKTQNIKIPS
jgi:hypothetical protein